MKKVTVILKTLVLLIMSASAMANTASALKVSVKSNHIMISLETASTQPLEIKIQDKDGQVLYSERSSKKIIERHKYNVKDFPAGDYLIKVSQGNTIRIQPFIKEFEGLSVDQAKVLIYFNPIFNQKLDHVDMNLLCSHDFATTIQILDSNREVLYREDVRAGGKVEKRFDLSKLEQGSYTFLVRVSSSIYENEVYRTFEVADMHASL